MRQLFLVLCLSGCAATPSEPANALNFHDFVDADLFCETVGMGYTLGWRTQQPNPWSDQLFCLSPDGLYVISATRNGGEARVSDNNWEASAFPNTLWMARTDRHDPRVGLADRLVDSCPDRSSPLAIIPRKGSAYPGGAAIDVGDRLCLFQDELVLYRDDGTDGNDPNEGMFHEAKRWTGFVPSNP